MWNRNNTKQARMQILTAMQITKDPHPSHIHNFYGSQLPCLHMTTLQHDITINSVQPTAIMHIRLFKINKLPFVLQINNGQ